MAWASSCVAPRRRTSVSTSFSESSGRASAFVVASFMVAYSSASWACGWSCNNPGYAAFFKLSSTTFDHSSRTTKGDRWLKRTLVQAAWAASHTKGTYLAAHYRRLAKRRGRKKALVAVGHTLLVIIYHVPVLSATSCMSCDQGEQAFGGCL